MLIEFIKIGLELLLQSQRTWEIVRGEDVTLHFAEDDLDLIEPTGVRRQPVNPDFKMQPPATKTTVGFFLGHAWSRYRESDGRPSSLCTVHSETTPAGRL